MKQRTMLAASVALIAAAIGGGSWLGHLFSEENAAPTNDATDGTGTSRKERRLLYYRNPMGLQDTSPVPKKDQMGMDYIPVYEGEEPDTASNQIKISVEKVQKLGVRTEKASLRPIEQSVRAVGRVEANESRVYAVAPKFEGYVVRLHVNANGQEVMKGQPLFDIYSPELASVQREYVIAAQGARTLRNGDEDAMLSMKGLAAASLRRLKNWDISDEQIRTLVKTRDARRHLTLRSPVSGVVTEKKALQGMRFMPGELLYQVADLSTVWVLADVFEQDIGLVEPHTPARVTISAYPGKEFIGTVSYVYPSLQPETRTVPVRIELDNTERLLKPGMFAEVDLGVVSLDDAVTVPTSAVIDSGLRRVVLVQVGPGRFEPRDVKLGVRGGDYVQVLEGVSDGEDVVVAANFLIDSESNLKAAIGGLNPPPVASAGHKAKGTVDEISAADGVVVVTHGPVASLKWPDMTMEFKVANPSLLKDLRPGIQIDFEFVERGAGEWVITSFTKAAGGHAGH